MARRSIAARIFSIVLIGNLIVLFLVLGTSWWALEGLEATFIESEKQIELEYFEKYGNKSQPLRIQTAQMISAFQPNAMAEPMELPVMFKKLPIPFQGEIKLQGKEYLAVTHAFPEGTYYVAKSLEQFEAQESKVIVFISILAISVIVVSLLLAYIASRLIARPIVEFSEDIQDLETSQLKARMRNDFIDAELNVIAKAINIQLDQIEEVFQRERALIAMASHELRTPIAVILGAANIIEQRNQLPDNDKVTLGRITRSATEMTSNIQALLHLVRRTKSETGRETISIRAILDALEQEYRFQQPASENRLVIDKHQPDINIHSDKTLVKILLHNIISNALNHATGKVRVTLHANAIEIADEGVASSYAKPQKDDGKFVGSTGLGMYIVDLICEHIHWRYKISTNEQAGTTVTFHLDT